MQFWLHYQDPLFDSTHVVGMWSFEHILLLGVFLLLAVLMFRFMMKRTLNQREKILRGYAVFLMLLEVTRVTWNLIVNDVVIWNDVLPLYTCGIFIVALPLSVTNTPLKKASIAFIKISATLSGLAFLLFPSTALVDYPIWHYNTLQSFVMHTSMMITGILYWLPPYQRTTKKDWYYFMGWVTVYGIAAGIVNTLTDSNLMFVGQPLPNTPLVWVEMVVGPTLYGVFIILLHYLWGALMWWIATLVYDKVSKFTNKNSTEISASSR